MQPSEAPAEILAAPADEKIGKKNIIQRFVLAVWDLFETGHMNHLE